MAKQYIGVLEQITNDASIQKQEIAQRNLNTWMASNPDIVSKVFEDIILAGQSMQYEQIRRSLMNNYNDPFTMAKEEGYKNGLVNGLNELLGMIGDIYTDFHNERRKD